jgi:LysM repeat protein
MKKSTSAFARIFAALALVAAVLAVVLLVSAGLKNDSSSKKGHRSGNATTQESTHHRTKAKTYTVKTGDTLIAIAHQTGVSVAELQALNPEVDPQILIAGQTLKLR